MNLFGTDGIRGKYGNYPLDDSFIQKIGFALSKFFNGNIKRILICQDGRESSLQIITKLLEGILSDRQYEIKYLGIFPTPSIPIILSENDKRDTVGIIITASHNPYTDNGIKIFNGNGLKLSQDEELQIEKNIPETISINPDISIQMVQDDSYRDIYSNKITEIFNSKKKSSHKLNIAVDCANGAMSEVISTINFTNNININIFNNSPNGSNINDRCGAVCPEQLSEIISNHNKNNDKTSIDFGICFDGDGDRAVIINSVGEILDGDDLLYLFSIYTNDIKKVVGTVMTNFGIRKNLSLNGIKFIETDVGDKNVLEAVKKNNCLIGTESSGHIVRNDIIQIPIGDALVTMIKFIHLLYDIDKNIYEVYPKSLKVPSMLINVETSSPDILINNNKSKFTKVEKILQKDGRILVRKSGTQSMIRILIEHESEDLLQEAKEVIDTLS
ncbi:MAG: hypothetical protein VW416_00675 [Gammaproteobacteria bacterium]